MTMPRPPKLPPRLHHEKNGFWYWKPSKRLREEGGFRTAALGEDMRAAFAAARALNKPADEWLKSAGQPARKKKPAAPERPGGLTFSQLATRFRESHAFREGLRAATQASYRDCLKILEAEFGHDRAALVNRARVLGWADPLRSSAPQGLRHYAAVARRLYNWAQERELVAFDKNPFDKIGVAPNRRKSWIAEADLKLLVAEADAGSREHGARPDIGTALVIGFFCVQRISDVLRLTTANLTGGGARLTLEQSKTGREIDMALPQPVRQRLAAHPATAGGLLCHWPEGGGTDPDRAARDAFAVILARLSKRDRAAAKRLEGVQLRDVRRSGFVYYATKPGVTVHLVCSMSGHTIEEGMEIVETYLPKTPEQADMAIAMAATEW